MANGFFIIVSVQNLMHHVYKVDRYNHQAKHRPRIHIRKPYKSISFINSSF